MSGSTIGGVVGAVVGSFIPGVGTQLGWMIGSAIGGYIDPEQISQSGPRLQDASTQTSRDGIPITFGYGTFPTAGNIIWTAPLVEHVNRDTERQGKGGPEVTTTTYTYTRSYAIGICEGPVTGLLQIKRNGKIVYDARTDSEIEETYNPAGDSIIAQVVAMMISGARAASASFLSKCTIYLGDEAQLPDPTIEAHEGSGNVGANRGLCYIVVTDDDLTDFNGAIPQYEFVVSVAGTVAEEAFADTFIAGTKDTLNTDGETGFSPNGTAWIEAPNATFASHYVYGDGILLKFLGSNSYASTDRGATFGSAVAIGNTPETRPYFDGTQFLVAGSGGLGVSLSTSGASWSDVAGVSSGAERVIGGNANITVVGSNDGHASFASAGSTTFSTPSVDVGGGALGGPPITAISDGGPVVVLGDGDGNLYWTTDGITYTACSGSPFTNDVKRIHYNEAASVYVGCGQDGHTGYSSDGKAWSASADLNGADIDSNGSTIVMVANPSPGGVGKIHTSNDGQTWTERAHLFSPEQFVTVAAMPCDGYAIPDAPGFYALPDGSICGGTTYETLDRDTVTVAAIVTDLCERVGITASQIDVTGLSTRTVDGYRIHGTGGADSFIAPLMQAHFFDAGEWDAKIRFVLRGGVSSFALGPDDLVEREGDAFESERVQEAELLRKVTVGYLDPAANYTPTTQQWERRSGTVLAKGEGAVEIPVVAGKDDAAQIAEKRGKVAWSETEKYRFSLTTAWTKLTPTDVGTYTDSDGHVHRMRLMQREDESGELILEASRDRQAAYTGTATGVGVPPVVVTPDVRGPTILRALNLPSLTTADNEPGIYLAATGLLPGWLGCVVYLSLDGGVTYHQVMTITTRAKMGELVTGIDTNDEPITVDLYDGQSLSSVTTAQIDARANAWAITTGGVSEIGQHETSTANGDFYDLTDTYRGRLGTTAASHAAGAAFTMLDAAVKLLPVDPQYSGETLYLKAVSMGTDADAAEVVTVVYDPPTFIIDGGSA